MFQLPVVGFKGVFLFPLNSNFEMFQLPVVGFKVLKSDGLYATGVGFSFQ